MGDGRRRVGQGVGLGLEVDLGHLGQRDEEEGDGEAGAHAGDGEVDPLDVVEVVLVAVREEELGGDEGADEARDTVPRLRELEAERGGAGGRHDRDVRVGRHLKRGETAGDDGGADDEAGKDGLLVVAARELGDGPERSKVEAGVSKLGEEGEEGAGVRGSDAPEQDRAERVEAQAHDDGKLVAPATEDLTGDGGKGEVTGRGTKGGGVRRRRAGAKAGLATHPMPK